MKKDIEAGVEHRRAVINVHDYAARTSIDLVGEGACVHTILFNNRGPTNELWYYAAAAFDYQFGALDNEKNNLRETFRQTE